VARASDRGATSFAVYVMPSRGGRMARAAGRTRCTRAPRWVRDECPGVRRCRF
jgi:hypothetical protein